MKVKYKNGSIYGPGLVDFPYQEGDYITIVVRYWDTTEDEDDIYYHGHITEFEDEREGFWARLDDAPDNEEFFHFGDLEAVSDGDKIPFLGGWTKRIMANKFNLTDEQLELFNGVHSKHLQALGTEARKKRTVEHVKNLVWDTVEDCLKVYYDDGEWWHYTKDKKWF
jgi:hypothetical protein